MRLVIYEYQVPKPPCFFRGTGALDPTKLMSGVLMSLVVVTPKMEIVQEAGDTHEDAMEMAKNMVQPLQILHPHSEFRIHDCDHHN